MQYEVTKSKQYFKTLDIMYNLTLEFQKLIAFNHCMLFPPSSHNGKGNKIALHYLFSTNNIEKEQVFNPGCEKTCFCRSGRVYGKKTSIREKFPVFGKNIHPWITVLLE